MFWILTFELIQFWPLNWASVEIIWAFQRKRGLKPTWESGVNTDFCDVLIVFECSYNSSKSWHLNWVSTLSSVRVELFERLIRISKKVYLTYSFIKSQVTYCTWLQSKYRLYEIRPTSPAHFCVLSVRMSGVNKAITYLRRLATQ